MALTVFEWKSSYTIEWKKLRLNKIKGGCNLSKMDWELDKIYQLNQRMTKGIKSFSIKKVLTTRTSILMQRELLQYQLQYT